MKLAVSAILAVSSVAAAAKTKTRVNDQRKLDDEMHAAAFGAVVPGHSASEWKNFLSDGPLAHLKEMDSELSEKPANNKNKKSGGRELWDSSDSSDQWWWGKPDDKPNVPKVGYYGIDNSEYGGTMDVKNRGNEECFTAGEGIGKNGWAFGITAGRIPNTNTTDTYLQLFDKDAPLKPLYKAFQGATKLCIGEKKGNIAYLYVVYGDATYWLIGYPDAGRKDHLPKLKIRDSRRRRLNDAEKINDKYNNGLGEYVVVRFRDGPGITNTLWEIFEDGSDHISPDAKWYKTGNDDP